MSRYDHWSRQENMNIMRNITQIGCTEIHQTIFSIKNGLSFNVFLWMVDDMVLF